MRKVNLPEKLKNVQADSTLLTLFFAGILTSLAVYFRKYLIRFWHVVTSYPKEAKDIQPTLTPENLKKLDIEIRYETEKDADAVLLAENVLKVVKIVLLPVADQVKEEEAKLIFVFNGDSWEIRMRNASDHLRDTVRSLLEAKEW